MAVANSLGGLEHVSQVFHIPRGLSKPENNMNLRTSETTDQSAEVLSACKNTYSHSIHANL